MFQQLSDQATPNTCMSTWCQYQLCARIAYSFRKHACALECQTALQLGMMRTD